MRKRLTLALFGTAFALLSCVLPLSEDKPKDPEPNVPPVEAPRAPGGLRCSGLTDTRATIAWSSSGSGLQYRLYRDGTLLAATAERAYSDRGLEPNRSYQYSVSAGDGAGRWSERSGPLTVRTAGTLSGPAATYYIDPENGDDDANDGLSTDRAWRSFRNLVSYSGEHSIPHAAALRPGDTVYVLDGTIDRVCRPGDGSGPPDASGRPALLFLRGVHGTEDAPIRIQAYPGHRPALDAGYRCQGVYIEQSSWITWSGIDVSRGMGNNFQVAETSHFTLSGSRISLADGSDNNNISGFSAGASHDILIERCVFHDNYDRSASDTGGITTENSTNMVFFQGSDITVRSCLVYQSREPRDGVNTGAGIKYKHSTPDPEGYFRVYDNVFRNCKYFSVQSGSANTHVHHNIFIGGNVPFSTHDCGGFTHQKNQVFEYNTVYLPVQKSDPAVSESALQYSPTIDWRNAAFPDDPKNIAFRRNIVVQGGRYVQEHGTLTLGAYTSDELYALALPELFVDDNVYFNAGGHDLRFSMAAARNYGEAGGYYSWDDWRALAWTDPATGSARALGMDKGSLIADPRFREIDLGLERFDPAGNAFRPASGSPAEAMGAYAGRTAP